MVVRPRSMVADVLVSSGLLLLAAARHLVVTSRALTVRRRGYMQV